MHRHAKSLLFRETVGCTENRVLCIVLKTMLAQPRHPSNHDKVIELSQSETKKSAAAFCNLNLSGMIPIEIARIQAAKADSAVLAELFELFWNPIFRYLLRRTANVELAKDLTQETFLKAYRNFARFTPEHEFSFTAWLFRIATNEANQRFRFLGRHREIHMDGKELEIALEKELRAANDELQKYNAFLEIHGYMQKLKSHYQAVLSFHYFEELTLEEIAHILEQNSNTIRTWHRRALQELRRYIE